MNWHYCNTKLGLYVKIAEVQCKNWHFTCQDEVGIVILHNELECQEAADRFTMMVTIQFSASNKTLCTYANTFHWEWFLPSEEEKRTKATLTKSFALVNKKISNSLPLSCPTMVTFKWFIYLLTFSYVDKSRSRKFYRRKI